MDESKPSQDSAPEESKDEIPRENILMEKKLMRHYNRCLMGEMALYGVVLGTALYMGAALITGTFSVKVANYVFIAPGMTMSGSIFYFRAYHQKSLENQLEIIYKPQFDKYQSFFTDKGYDDYE